MKTTECDREADVLEAVVSGCWPAGDAGEPGDDLRSHVAGCPVCADLAAVAVALRNERDDAWREARVPTSGQVWWRATMRTRAEATAAAAWPITMLQGLAAACAAGVCAVLITRAWPSAAEPFAGIAASLSQGAQRFAGAALSAVEMNQALLSLALLVGAGLILSPFVLYFVLSDE